MIKFPSGVDLCSGTMKRTAFSSVEVDGRQVGQQRLDREFRESLANTSSSVSGQLSAGQRKLAYRCIAAEIKIEDDFLVGCSGCSASCRLSTIANLL
jgi:hypothetical protein